MAGSSPQSSHSTELLASGFQSGDSSANTRGLLRQRTYCPHTGGKYGGFGAYSAGELQGTYQETCHAKFTTPAPPASLGPGGGPGLVGASLAQARPPSRPRFRSRWTTTRTTLPLGPGLRPLQRSGRSCGKRITSLMESAPRRIMARRSMPIPSPPAGGMPYSRARRKSSSRT